MELCDIRVIRALLARHGMHFSKAKGQNFLCDARIPAEIAALCGADESCGVLEIGPGVGCLTTELCAVAGKVLAVEVDEALRPILAETMEDQENLELLFGDVLKQDIPALVDEHLGGLRPMACANLPYYITTPVLTALLEAERFEAVTVMVQKEVAERICAKPATPEYGAFTVFCRYYADPEIVLQVPSGCFIPQPKVDSAVVRLAVRGAPPCEIRDKALFFKTVRASFAHRRKTLRNGLSAGFPQLPREELSAILAECGFPETVRGETLDIPAFAKLAEAVGKRL